MGTTTTPMSNDEIVENLKTMVFGVQAFDRFNAKERETLDKAWNIIDQYENRLKADMVAMLEDLKQDFIAEAYGIEMDCTDYVVNVADIDKVIQEKINEIKGNKNGNDRN